MSSFQWFKYLITCLFFQILGLSDPDQIEREVRIIAIGFIGLAVFSGITYFTAVSFVSSYGSKLWIEFYTGGGFLYRGWSLDGSGGP